MSVHSTFYQNEKERKADLASEYRTEQAGLYHYDDEEPKEPDCDKCIHYKYHKGKIPVYACEKWECEFKEKENK